MTEAFICDYVRTPIGRYGGALASVRADDLATAPIRELMRRHPGLGEKLDEVFLGCANQAGEDNRNLARMALLLAGLPESVPGATVNRLCASGMEAVAAAARGIKAGEIKLAIAGGAESMTRAPFVMGKAQTPFQRSADVFDTTIGWRFINPAMKKLYGVDSMPETAENVADEYQVSRADQDAFALRSQKRAAAAQAKGTFRQEIVAVEIKDRKGSVTRVETDEHPRPDTTLEALARLGGIVREGGSVTAGNASGVERRRRGADRRLGRSGGSAWTSADRSHSRLRHGGRCAAGDGGRPDPGGREIERAARVSSPQASTSSSSTKPSPRRRSPASGGSASPTIPSTSTRTAGRSRSAIRLACQGRAWPAPRRSNSGGAAAATGWRPCASASARARRWRSNASDPIKTLEG